MSQLIGLAAGQRLFGFDDTRLNRMDFQPVLEMADIWAIANAPFTTDWWPGGAGINGDVSVDASVYMAVQWGQYDQAAGSSSRYVFMGVTRDAYGSPVGTCVVKLMRTSDDTVIDTVTSDENGNFQLNTPYYPTTHYIYSHKSGSPDIDGVTPNTLIGT